MKKVLLSFAASAMLLNIHAQCTATFPENGFENWINKPVNPSIPYEAPATTWLSLTDLTGYAGTGIGTPVINKTTDKYSGTYAMKVTTPPGMDADLIGLGNINSRPLKFSGYYKYDGGANDSLIIVCNLLKGLSLAPVVVATSAEIDKPAVATYTKFSINFHYVSPVIPDTFFIIINSFNHNTVNVNAWFDDICFEGTYTGINENELITKCSFFNTGNNKFLLAMDFEKPMEAFTAQIFDLSGREVYSKSLNNQTSTDFLDEFNLQHLNSGFYILKLYNNTTVVNRKFLVQ